MGLLADIFKINAFAPLSDVPALFSLRFDYTEKARTGVIRFQRLKNCCVISKKQGKQ